MLNGLYHSYGSGAAWNGIVQQRIKRTDGNSREGSGWMETWSPPCFGCIEPQRTLEANGFNPPVFAALHALMPRPPVGFNFSSGLQLIGRAIFCIQRASQASR